MTPSNRLRINRGEKPLLSPALSIQSHLSEGDQPLLKPAERSVVRPKHRKTTHIALRTPATKEPRRRMTSRFDQSQQTPITRTGLKKLRVVDLKKKLRKHSLKVGGKKDELVDRLKLHLDTKREHDDGSEQDDDSEIEVGHIDLDGIEEIESMETQGQSQSADQSQIESSNTNTNTQGQSQSADQSQMLNAVDSENEEMDSDDEESEDIEHDWIGDCIGKKVTEEGDRAYYAAMMLDGERYDVGDKCFVQSTGPNGEDERWLASLTELYEEDGDYYVGNNWFWKFPDIKRAVKIKPHADWAPLADEVFVGVGHPPDRNHISLIREKFEVFHTVTEMELYRQTHAEGAETFLCQYEFRMKEKRLVKRQRDCMLEEEVEGRDRSVKRQIDAIEEGDEEEEAEKRKKPLKTYQRKRKAKSKSNVNESCNSREDEDEAQDDGRKTRQRRRRRMKSTK